MRVPYCQLRDLIICASIKAGTTEEDAIILADALVTTDISEEKARTQEYRRIEA